MDERDVRLEFFDQLFKRDDGDADEAVAQTYLAVAIHIVTTLNLPDSPGRFWETVSLALRLKTDLCRKEMYPGPKDLSIVPFGPGDEMVLHRVYEAERDVLGYMARNLAALPASPFKERRTRQAIESEIEEHRREIQRIAHDYIVKQFTMLPRARVESLNESADQFIKALLGVPMYDRFAHEFNAAQGVIRLEQDRPETTTTH